MLSFYLSAHRSWFQKQKYALRESDVKKIAVSSMNLVQEAMMALRIKLLAVWPKLHEKILFVHINNFDDFTLIKFEPYLWIMGGFQR